MLNGRAVTSTIAQQLFFEVRGIARSDAPLSERRAEARKRINQFAAALSAARILPAEAEKQRESLRRTLQRAATQHDLTAEENSVYAEALEVLMGQGR